MAVQVHMRRMAAHRHKRTSNPSNIYRARSNKQKTAVPRRSGISWLLWSGSWLSQFQRLAETRPERIPESRRGQAKTPKMDRWHIVGVGNHVGGSCEAKFDSGMHLNASLVHYEYFPQLTRTRIDAQHIPARPAGMPWCTGRDWRPCSAPPCVGALWIPGSGLEKVKHV